VERPCFDGQLHVVERGSLHHASLREASVETTVLFSAASLKPAYALTIMQGEEQGSDGQARLP
jgi:hypothetical protein